MYIQRFNFRFVASRDNKRFTGKANASTAASTAIYIKLNAIQLEVMRTILFTHKLVPIYRTHYLQKK